MAENENEDKTETETENEEDDIWDKIDLRYVIIGTQGDMFLGMGNESKYILGVFKNEETAEKVSKFIKEERPDIKRIEITKIMWEE